MAELMAIVNLTPDSFYAPSRVAPDDTDAFLERVRSFAAAGASILDLGAVSTRPGAVLPSLEEEWERLEPALEALRSLIFYSQAAMGCRTSPLHRSADTNVRISIDTFRAEIVRRAYEVIGDFIVNDISAGEDDPEMLPTVGRLGLEYVAMHKRGAPGTMDSLCDYPDGVMAELVRYFTDFERRAAAAGVERWILDPGLGFAKTVEQNWEILRRLPELQRFGRPILIGAADKRFTRQVPPDLLAACSPESSCAPEPLGHPEHPLCHPEHPLCHPERSEGSPSPTALGTSIAHRLALQGGAAILRVHDINIII